MQTQLADFIRDTPKGKEADSILRSCVHCGFCTATCPTYQLLGDELDGPRGRIYLIKSVLEGEQPSARTQQHLDRCLSCRSCETTCPSGVNYHRLLDIGREVVEEKVPRPLLDRLIRRSLLAIMPRRHLFTALLRLGQTVCPLLPRRLKSKIPPRQRTGGIKPPGSHSRKVVMLEGCVQPGIAPATNIAATRVLDALGISVISTPGAGCCGALRFHLNDQAGARADMKRNIDAWQRALSGGAEAVVSTASGCGAHLREYGTLLADDPTCAQTAQRITDQTRDIAEILAAEEQTLTRLLAKVAKPSRPRRVAFHSPCTLQHGLGIRGLVERLLTAANYELVPVADSHLCCGSAGTYSLLQPVLSEQLRKNKLAALNAQQPELIATANIGCQAHLQSGGETPVAHWIELIADALGTEHNKESP
ncbi:MAG: glycolate oxidase iron-sulfur subunit [Porticoccaceae bacterium]|nr:glycolate oxidase iron-sulfur subunit [Porticoccaceae bacterium]